ncbi:MAG: bifunctional phosphopantothenoylcysteine decarboxylase/phosphopantothenate--cysteine ligase CoaBC [Acidobacteria bacterium]|nr:MAG: bifunctional phosphopantothenoylcysteine decarboxylase/phosphopantothenate--cysteine ligase CoaBC [Acidobacteriota bacterium]
MSNKPGREIALGICGGIGAYKTPELVRQLVRSGVQVTVILTKHAEAFVTPLTLQTLTGRAVVRELYDLSAGGDVEHIALSRRISLLAVAPATAATLARFAHGSAQDFLSTFFLAVSCPVLMAPSMNTRMLLHPATQANLAVLKSRGIMLMEPEAGELACGEMGSGRLPEPEAIAHEILRCLSRGETWAGETVLVTAGPTREYVDPARVLTNPSSGRMGYAVAEEAIQRGARVVLISGPSSLAAPWGAELVRVETTEEMRRAVLEALPRSTIVIKAAAPADFRPSLASREKVAKGKLTRLELEPTPDILAEIAGWKNGQLVVGFSAGTGDYAESARRKLREKRLDLVVANPVDEPGVGFAAENNRVILIAADGSEQALPLISKREVAARLLDRIESIRKGRA